MVERRANFSSDLDVRGKRAEEAIVIFGNFLDNAILFGTPSVRIIHGKGDRITSYNVCYTKLLRRFYFRLFLLFLLAAFFLANWERRARTVIATQTATGETR